MFETIETLENRRLYSVSATLGSNGFLTVIGTSGVDDVYISTSAGNIVLYESNVATHTYAPGSIKKMKFDMGDGDDEVFYGLFDALPTTMKGGNGADRLIGGPGVDQIDGGDGNDIITCGAGNDYADGGLGNDQVSGITGNDTLLGGDGADLMSGGFGNDLIDGGLGADRIRGNEDIDTVTYASRTNDVSVDLSEASGEQPDDGEAGEGDFVESDVENIIGGSGNDTLVGTTFAPNPPNTYTLNNMIYGGDGDDTIQGLDGNDVLDGQAGNDSIGGNAGRDKIYGGLGNDIIRGHGGADLLYGQAHIDKIWGGDGNDYIDGGTSNDRLQGDAGDDTIIGYLGDDHVYAKNDGGTDSIDGQDGFDDIRVDVLDIHVNCEDIG